MVGCDYDLMNPLEVRVNVSIPRNKDAERLHSVFRFRLGSSMSLNFDQCCSIKRNAKFIILQSRSTSEIATPKLNFVLLDVAIEES